MAVAAEGAARRRWCRRSTLMYIVRCPPPIKIRQSSSPKKGEVALEIEFTKFSWSEVGLVV